ncbi:MAG: hypothetical protein FRX48_06852 [Lasallia pustulata]|uniref:TRAPP III complex, Trs85 n=1 Tax=Lasallia pustulata TaxID=136370 RepID=A0A5M8PIR6_9LECA|nr:MAG: hypothetical protein FRX48_06852 [Lasallia pustulata]
MTSSEDAHPVKPPSPLTSSSSPVLSKARRSSNSEAIRDHLPHLGNESPLVQSLTSTLLPPPITSAPRSVTSANGSRPSPYKQIDSTSGIPSPSLVSEGRPDEPRSTILRAFVPHVAVYASSDTEDLIRGKGVEGGLQELLRCFGERIQGKVVIRDSVGASRGWEDFGIRFFNLGDDPTHSGTDHISSLPTPGKSDKPMMELDQVIDHYLSSDAPVQAGQREADYVSFKTPRQESSTSTSPFFAIYLRKLLSGMPMVAHETFSHPVACVIAISSHSPAPIEALRQLYSNTSQGDRRVPAWVSNEYLRYYVLVHDEDTDDITKSTSLFEQMKRHFGLHCHLLRLRSSQCIPTDDESFRVPSCDWLSASEELSDILKKEDAEDVEDPNKFVFESDAAAIRTFLREMVTQSIVPFMENRVAVWNDQVASRRRGISGRFMSLSKRWTGFGSARGSPSIGASGSASLSGNNYDPVHGYYPPETPEATMRRLADYAFMLRDWKLSQSTYELLKSDFGNDKAWRYHAGANEMSAISMLLIPQALSFRNQSEALDQMLDTASYSYLSRCSSAYGTVRCLIMAVELLRTRGAAAAEEAAKWAMRLLEFAILSPIAEALVVERVAECYKSRLGAGTHEWGLRRRKAALWCVLASDAWLRLERDSQAKLRLQDASALYGRFGNYSRTLSFAEMQNFWEKLESVLRSRSGDSGAVGDEMTEKLGHGLLVGEKDGQIGVLDHRQSWATRPGHGPPEGGLSSTASRTYGFSSAKDEDFE